MKSFRTALVALVAVAAACTVSIVRAEDEKPATSQPAKVAPVDYKKLKEVMPAELAGIKRSNNEGQKTGIGEFVMTQATAEYQKPDAGENDPKVTVELTDYSSAIGMAEGMTAWSKIEIDKDSDSGFERTTKVKGQPAYETYQNEGKSGEIQLWVNGHFLLNVRTTNLSADDFKKLADSLPIEKIAALK